jgi:hypothetical protein
MNDWKRIKFRRKSAKAYVEVTKIYWHEGGAFSNSPGRLPVAGETPMASHLYGITLLNLNELMTCVGPQDLC